MGLGRVLWLWGSRWVCWGLAGFVGVLLGRVGVMLAHLVEVQTPTIRRARRLHFVVVFVFRKNVFCNCGFIFGKIFVGLCVEFVKKGLLKCLVVLEKFFFARCVCVLKKMFVAMRV